MQGTFLLLHLLTRVAFKMDTTYSFIVASCMKGVGLEVEASRKAFVWMFSSRVRVNMIGRDCESKILEILLMVDPQDWGVTTWHHYIYVHGDIASSQVWVHGMVIHHSG